MVIVSWHFFFFLKPDEFKWGEQIIQFIILTNLFFCQNEFLTVFILCLTAVHLRLLLWLKQIHVELKRLLFKFCADI